MSVNIVSSGKINQAAKTKFPQIGKHGHQING